MIKITKAMGMVSKAASSHHPIDEVNLIQARVDQHIRPNLDLITLPELGSIKYLGSGHEMGGELPISARCTLQSAVQRSSLFKERGIFGVYDHPSAKIGHHCTFHAWGLNKNARWLQIEFDVCKQWWENDSWDEVLTDLRSQEVSLRTLLDHMKSFQHGKESDGVWNYEDKYGTDHYIISDPGTIWYALTRFILKWHREQRKRYVRSKRFAEDILLEDLTVETFSKSFS